MTLKYSHFLHEDYYGQCVYEYTKNEGLSEGCNTFYYKTGGREQQDTSFIEYFFKNKINLSFIQKPLRLTSCMVRHVNLR